MIIRDDNFPVWIAVWLRPLIRSLSHLAEVREQLNARVRAKEIDGYVWLSPDVVEESTVLYRARDIGSLTVQSDLRARRRVRAIADIWSCTTYVDDLFHRMLQILAKKHHGIFQVVNEGVCSYYEFALEAGRLAGMDREEIDPLIEKVHLSEMTRPAIRPRYTPMRCLLSEKLGLEPMRQWRAALADYVRNQTGS
jgi:dTDP-4-dehydrorhamnose reductase